MSYIEIYTWTYLRVLEHRRLNRGTQGQFWNPLRMSFVTNRDTEMWSTGMSTHSLHRPCLVTVLGAETHRCSDVWVQRHTDVDMFWHMLYMPHSCVWALVFWSVEPGVWCGDTQVSRPSLGHAVKATKIYHTCLHHVGMLCFMVHISIWKETHLIHKRDLHKCTNEPYSQNVFSMLVYSVCARAQPTESWRAG